MLEKIIELRKELKAKSPLIHCLTNHITINDCANIILAVGAKPIMAEHKDEVCEITKKSSALVLNLGNITNDRMASMLLSSRTAKDNNIPIILDPVGVACSSLRLKFAKDLIKNNTPSIIKGNMSEIKALLELENSAVGVDVGKRDSINGSTVMNFSKIAKDFALRCNCVVVVTGEIDIITNGIISYLIYNGDRMMSEITGSGCMCSALIGAYCSSGNSMEAAITATSIMSISGELAALNCSGIGTFKTAFFDNIYNLSDELIKEKIKLKEVQV